MITKVYDSNGTLMHDCASDGCTSSWDGYVIAGPYDVPNPDATEPGAPAVLTLNAGDALPGRSDPGPRWDLSRPGEAHLKPSE